MIIISSGFPKSASTLLFLYTEKLIMLSGKSRGQKIFRRFNKEGFTPWFHPLNACWYIIASLFGPVVIKTHSGPCFSLRVLMSLGLAKAYYSIRDPRDVVLSALDHASKARASTNKSDSDKAFAPFHNLNELRPALEMHFKRYKSWMKDGRALILRYEDVLQNPKQSLEKVTAHINRPALQTYIDETVTWFAARKPDTINFNKGVLHRFESEMTPEEIQTTEQALKEIITSMNYPLTKS